MLFAAKFVCLLASTLFAGASLFITLISHPVRLSMEPKAAGTSFIPFYKGGTRMQAPLALISSAAGIYVFIATSRPAWLITAALFIGIVVFTTIVMMPTNNKIVAKGRDYTTAESRALIVRWGNLHAVRTALSMVGSVLVAYEVCL